ncbi:MAG TPA: FG-GAP-like repeat-containing protein, partial [Candidatus Binatia bacterium]|nr:FG-GAP-like repeat-containing protein [Candidatus Binatia bacterium]
MTFRLPAALIATLLAAFGILHPDSQPNAIEAARLNNLGCAYMNQQLFEKGLKQFQQAAAADPKFAIARLNEGVAYLNLQKVDDARAALQDALKQDPKSPNAWYSLGLLAKNSGDAASAIDAFKRVTEIDPNDADTWYFLGTAYAQAKQFPQAIDSFNHALKINPLHASAEFGLSRAYQQSSDVNNAREHLKKFQYITQNKYGSPMSLAYGEQGQYSRAVESPQAALRPPPQVKVQFVDVTKEAGTAGKALPDSSDPYRLRGPGACFIDYDNDGKVDLFLPDNGSQGGMTLYHNLGNGKFEVVTSKAGLDPTVHGLGCTAGDYDNDGFTDLAVTVDGHVKLFHNEKDGTFADVTQQSGIKGDGYSYSLTFVDYDHDGDTDLYVLQMGRGQPVAWLNGVAEEKVAAANQMWRNNGNGTFTDQAEQTGLAGITPGMAAIGTDYNNDRAVDLIVTGRTLVYKNQREGKFLPQQLFSSLDSGAAVLDFDHDGWMDVAFSGEPTRALTLWHNHRGTAFEQLGELQTNWVRAFGVAAFDYDNDGWVDLVAVGETKDGKGEIKLFRNLGPDGFKDVTADVGLDKIHLENPRAIITGDYDNDGAVDLLITQNHGPAVLL